MSLTKWPAIYCLLRVKSYVDGAKVQVGKHFQNLEKYLMLHLDGWWKEISSHLKCRFIARPLEVQCRFDASMRRESLSHPPSKSSFRCFYFFWSLRVFLGTNERPSSVLMEAQSNGWSLIFTFFFVSVSSILMVIYISSVL